MAGLLCLVGASAGVSTLGVSVAQAQTREELKTTFLVSRSVSGGFPNGPSRNPAISQDDRQSQVIAFESDASDIVPDDTNGYTDVFATSRTGDFSNEGELWVPGQTRPISSGLGGQPANGPSYAPTVDGAPDRPPRCAAFVSAASNLVPGDTNGKPDAFVFDLATGQTTRVSVNARGDQSDGTTFDVALDGRCTRVAFTSDAGNLAFTRVDGLPEDQQRARHGAITSRPRPGTKQVYVRVLKARHKLDRQLDGLTFLASASNGRRAGASDSFDPSFSARRGEQVAFTSEASLVSGDDNPHSDVYVRNLARVLSGQGHGGGMTVGALQPKTELISARADGVAGNGPSMQPSLNGKGDLVFFETEASDLLAGDANGVADIVRADRTTLPPDRLWVSKSTGSAGNGSSVSPVPSMGGTNAVFLSDSNNFVVEGSMAGGRDTNGVRDLYLWTVNRHLALLESRSSKGTLLPLPTTNLALSARTNYILFETSSPLADRELVSSLYPQWLSSPTQVESLAAQDPAFHQIYLRYLGPANIS